MTLQQLGRAWATIKTVAEQEGTTPAEVRAEMQEAIDEAWENSGDGKTAAWKEYFPNGQKPSVEEFIIILGNRIRRDRGKRFIK